jgi:hypothetical protein
MRRLLITGVVTAATFAAVALPASASFDSHFAVISEGVRADRTDDGFRFKEHLFQIDNPSNRIGRDKGVCAQRPHRKFKCKVLVHLNGEVGGFGDLRINGNFGPGDDRLNVTGGTGDFAGVGGKVVLSERATVLSFSLVD